MKAMSVILLVSLTLTGIVSSCSGNETDIQKSTSASLVQLTAEDHTDHKEPLVMKQFRGCKAHQ